MPYLICRQKIADYDRWKRVFDSHAAAQKASGLIVERVGRNLDNPSDVFALFRVTDLDKARAFVSSPDVPQAQRDSGVLGRPEIVFLD